MNEDDPFVTTGGLRVEFTPEEVYAIQRHSKEMAAVTRTGSLGWVRETYLHHAALGRIMTRAVNRAHSDLDIQQLYLPEFG